MPLAVRRRHAARAVVLDRSLEPLPLFRLSDSAEDAAVSFTPDGGGRWRVLPAPGERWTVAGLAEAAPKLLEGRTGLASEGATVPETLEGFND